MDLIHLRFLKGLEFTNQKSEICYDGRRELRNMDRWNSHLVCLNGF